MGKFVGWALCMVGLIALSRGGKLWQAHVISSFPSRGGGMWSEDWGYLIGTMLPGLVAIAIGYWLYEKRRSS